MTEQELKDAKVEAYRLYQVLEDLQPKLNDAQNKLVALRKQIKEAEVGK